MQGIHPRIYAYRFLLKPEALINPSPYRFGAEERSYEVDTTITLPKYDTEKHPISEGMKFTGWKVEVAGEQAKMLEVGDSFELKDNTVITPEYEKIPSKPLTKLKKAVLCFCKNMDIFLQERAY